MLKQKQKFWYNCAVDDSIDVALETIESYVGLIDVAELEKLKD